MAEYTPTTSRRSGIHRGASTGRRSLLSVAGLAPLVLAAAGAAADPDAELIALCRRLDALERAWLATDLDNDDDDAERIALTLAQAPVVSAICARPPATVTGFVALARSLALWAPDTLADPGPHPCTNDRLLSALLRGMVGEAVA